MVRRIRSIKPEFYENEALAGFDANNGLHRLLFSGLWTMADKQGRLEDRPRLIKTRILPYDNADVDRMLNDLATGDDPFIVRYVVDGQRLIQVRKFHLHQRPPSSERDSILPSYVDPTLKRRRGGKKPTSVENRPETGNVRHVSDTRLTHVRQMSDVCPIDVAPLSKTGKRSQIRPIKGAANQGVNRVAPEPTFIKTAPEIVNVGHMLDTCQTDVTHVSDGKGVEDQDQERVRPTKNVGRIYPAAEMRAADPAADARFEAFMAAYPRDTGRERARRAFAALSPDDALVAEMLRVLPSQVVQNGWNSCPKKFIPHAATWLDEKRWLETTAAPEPAVSRWANWREECAELHGSRCENPFFHAATMTTERERLELLAVERAKKWAKV